MAFSSASDRSVTESIKDDLLTCHVCREVFTDPRILPCLHTYCFRCIRTHVDTALVQGHPVVCPECQEPFAATDASTLNVNVFVDGMAEVTKYEKGHIDHCMPCKLRQKTSSAELVCLHCGDVLCEGCGRGHNSSSLTLHHQVVLVNDLRQGKYENALRNLKKIKCQCVKHTDVQFYCQSCCLLVCMSCVLIGHKGHNLQEISKAAVPCRSKIKSLADQTRKRVRNILNLETSLSDSMKTINTKHEQQKRLIEEKAEKEIARINAEKQKALKVLEVETKEVSQGCMKNLEKAQAEKTLFDSCLSFCESMLEKGKDEEVLMLETMVTERLERLQKIDLVTTGKDTIIDGASKGVVDTPVDGLKSLKLFNTFTVKAHSDSSDPDVRGLAYSSTIGLAVADKANGCIKVFKENGDFECSMSCPDFEPTSVAICKDVIAAISENYLCLMKVRAVTIKKIMLHEEKPNAEYIFTYSLAGHKTQTYFIVANIPADNRLRCYGIDGSLHHYISCTTTFPLSSMSVTPDGCIAVCEWKVGKVRIISKKGKILRDCEPGSKWRPNQIHASNDGYIFVGDVRGKGSRVFGFDEKRTCQLAHRLDVDGLLKHAFFASTDSGILYVLDRKGTMCVYRIVSNESTPSQVQSL